jgi:hypothetical protein
MTICGFLRRPAVLRLGVRELAVGVPDPLGRGAVRPRPIGARLAFATAVTAGLLALPVAASAAPPVQANVRAPNSASVDEEWRAVITVTRAGRRVSGLRVTLRVGRPGGTSFVVRARAQARGVYTARVKFSSLGARLWRVRVASRTLARGTVHVPGPAGVPQPATASAGCAGRQLERPFLPWLDVAYYTLAPNGGLEAGSTAWSLRGGATVVRGNETFSVRAPGDEFSLFLPSGSSATTGTTCVQLLDPTLRLFAMNSGSLLSLLQVEVLYADASGAPRALPIALLSGGARWRPTLPMPFLANLLHPPLVTDGNVDVAFRFTPVGLGKSGWKIDDVYVDPFRGA